MKVSDKFEKVSELARRRGFFWPSYEIYGGVGGFICWGPLGALLKRRIEDKFRDIFLRRLNFYEVETPIIAPERVFKASGHIDNFKEPMVECSACKRKFRADHLLQEIAGISSQETDKMKLEDIGRSLNEHGVKCPECGGLLSEPKYFLTMFQTNIGPYSDNIGYGRPEAAQGIFTEFKRLYEQVRERLPIGFAQIGHALRNEISPRQGPIRLREFTIIDLEFFFDPENPKCHLLDEVADEKLRLILAENRLKGDEKPVELTVREIVNKGYVIVEWLAFFMALAKRLVTSLGIPEDKQHFIEKYPWERAHYSAQGFDQEVYLERWGWVEVAGFNYRTDYDLSGHMRESGVDMRVFKQSDKETVREEIKINPVIKNIKEDFADKAPEVIRMLQGINPEAILEALDKQGFFDLNGLKITPRHIEAVRVRVKEKGKRFIPHVIEPSFGSDRLAYAALEYAYTVKEDRVILKLPRDIAPIQLAVLPLVSRDGLPEKAKEVYSLLLDEGFYVEYDESGYIGKRYARFDEIGVPLCITIDYQTLRDDTVTIRDRDTWRQVRTKIAEMPPLLNKYFRFKINFEDLGTPHR
ncbi:MAG: glycine--tRNA ligase [Candidatus Bathyarchaeia archaeon]|nr:glycine--tRNA ligase [Candidatus Bathyarchaeota archaeon]